MNYIFTNVLGTFILDNFNTIIDQGQDSKLRKMYPKVKELPTEKIVEILPMFKDEKYYSQFYQKNLELTKKSLKDSVSQDQLIVQAIANVNELDRVCNILVKRLREWYSWYNPELSEYMHDNEKFAQLVLTEKKDKDSMGAELSQINVDEIELLAKEVSRLYELRKKHEMYLKDVMQLYCPNLLELAGTTLAAGLLELGKSLKHLAFLPASTIQLLGAEKALFRHIKTGARSPKHGIIVSHPLVQNAKRNKRGRAARMLADKLSLCARLDFFKGEFKAKEYKKELEEKMKNN